MQKNTFSWGLIGLMLFLFFPVGIWMLVRKMTDEKLNYVKNGKALRVIGWVCLGLAVIYLVLGVSGELKYADGTSPVGILIIMVAGFAVGGVFALCKAPSYINRGQKYNRYISIITTGKNTLLKDIAAAYPAAYEEAVETVQTLINDGIFGNAYIDLERGELILPTTVAADKTPAG